MQDTAKGIRILDKIDRVVYIDLPDILIEVPNGEMYNWSILFLDGTEDLGPGLVLGNFLQQVNNSKDGFEISWKDINLLAPKFHQIIDIILIGSKDKSVLHRYKEDREMYESCDFTIIMFDSNYWEIFSKDKVFIDRLKLKFKETELLEPDYVE